MGTILSLIVRGACEEGTAMRMDKECNVFVAGDREWPLHETNTRISDWHSPDDRYAFFERHVWVAFENGWCASITWGSCTYSDNSDHSVITREFVEEPERVEVGVLHGESLRPGDPFGYLTAPEVNALLDVVKLLASDDRRSDDELTALIGGVMEVACDRA